MREVKEHINPNDS